MTCTACHKPTADGMYLCETCADALYAALNAIPDVLADLEITTAKLDAMGALGGSAGFDSTPPAKLDALDASYRIRSLVNSWTSMLKDYDRRKRKPKATVPVTFLRGSVNEIRKHDWAGSMHDEITEAVAHGQRIVDRPRDIRILGRCEQAYEIEDAYFACDGDIKADYEDPTATCHRCGASYLVADLMAERDRKVRGDLMTAAAARRYLRENAGVEIKDVDLKNWIRRGRVRYVLERVTTTGNGRRLYYPGDILRTHHEMQDRRVGV